MAGINRLGVWGPIGTFKESAGNGNESLFEQTNENECLSYGEEENGQENNLWYLPPAFPT